MNIEELKARINLHAVLTVLPELELAERENGGKGVGKAHGALAIKVKDHDELASTLWFTGKGIEVAIGNWRNPWLSLTFDSCESLNKSFAGDGSIRPKIRGIRGLLLLPKFIKMSKMLGKSLQGDDAPGGIKTKASLLLKLIVHAMGVVGKYDEQAAATAKNMDGIIQFTIEGGPSYHIIFHKGDISVKSGTHAAPKASLSWVDAETAAAVLSGKTQAMEAMAAKKMKMGGDGLFAMASGSILNKVGELLQPK